MLDIRGECYGVATAQVGDQGAGPRDGAARLAGQFLPSCRLGRPGIRYRAQVEGGLPAGMRAGAHSGGVPRRCLVPLVSGEVLDRIINEHLVGGRPVTDYVFAVDDLGTDE